MLSQATVCPTLPAYELDRAKDFYQNKLKLTLVEESEGGLVFSAGRNSSLLVYKSEYAGTNEATAAEWEVEDLEAEVAELRNNGVEFQEYDLPNLKTQDGIAELGDDKAAWFKDTEGNILAISQRGVSKDQP